tara:strand:- start:179 stop:547 length:369 start_codon:yes stop_codon:yes gene_type:complete
MSPCTKNSIKLENLTFYGFHGVYKKEIQEGQKFIITLDVSYDYTDNTDSISQTLDYIDLYKILKKFFKDKRYNLLETLGHEIINEIIRVYKSIYYIKINIKKPSIKIDKNKDFINVEVEYNK